MFAVNEYASYDAVGLADLLRKRQVSQDEVAAAAYAAAAVVNETLNAFTEGPWPETLEFDPTGRFRGVPFVLKDIRCHPRGVPMHSGSRVPADGIVFEHDTILMERLRRSGLAGVGTTRTPEFALSSTTEARFGGAVRNPWDLTRSPGGSSGGSAVLVAAGVVPIGHGGDGAGSLRIPAAHCGIIGLKPSRGRIPVGPDIAEGFYGGLVDFAMTRTVRDSAALLDVLHGNHPGEKYFAPTPSAPYGDVIENSQPRLRIAVTSGSWSGSPVHEDIRAAMSNVASILAEDGHHVDTVDPPIDWDTLCDAVTITLCSGTATAVKGLAATLNLGRWEDAPFERTTIACAEAGQAFSAVELSQAFATYNTITRSMAGFMSNWDVLVCPTSTNTAPPLGELNADHVYTAPEWVRKNLDPYPAGVIYNITGAPAMSVPVGVDRDGLPIGVQLGADMFREDLLIQLASVLEKRCWDAEWRPSCHVSKLC